MLSLAFGFTAQNSQASAFSRTSVSSSTLSSDHWAYDAVNYMAAQGYLEGIPDDLFTSHKLISRNEMAGFVERIIEHVDNGVPQYDAEVVKNLAREFSAELRVLATRVEKVKENLTEAKVKRASAAQFGKGEPHFSGEFSLSLYFLNNNRDTRGDDWGNYGMLSLGVLSPIDEKISFFASFMRDDIELFNLGGSSNQASASPLLREIRLDISDFFDLGDLRVGRQWMRVGRSMVLDDVMDGIRLKRKMGRVTLDLFTFTGHDSDGGANNRWYGNGSGTMNFYSFSDTRSIAASGGALNFNGANTGAGLNTINGGIAPLAPFMAGGATADAVTFYSSPFSGSTPWDSYTGSYLESVPNVRWNSHSGIAIQGGYDDNGDGIADSLAPVRIPVGFPVRRLFVPFGYVAPNGILDSAGTDSQTPVGLGRDWDVRSASGLESWGLNLAVDMGGHNLAAYFIRRDFTRYDPYTSLGDPWAAMVDSNNDMTIDADANGRDLSPDAQPWYLGMVIDGGIMRNLSYFIEAVIFDPDIHNIGVDPVTGDAVDGAGTGWKGNNLERGNAFLAGLDWKIGRKVNFVFQYGLGDEEFIPVSLYESTHPNGMVGRMTPGSYSGMSVGANTGTRMWGDVEGTGMLTGIRDILVSVKAMFNDRTSGFLKAEFVDEHDSSQLRTISGDSSVTGKRREDFRLITLSFEHIYRPDTTIFLQYDCMDYDDDNVNDAGYIGNPAFETDDVNWGGWDRVFAGIRVVY
jgi:hypothetical protein